MEEAKKTFLQYAKPYLPLGENIDLKIKHTFRVVSLCEAIAKKKNLSKEEIEIAKLCGLLHDIARFEQYKRYQTFSDLNSIDHGDLGVKILKENNFIRKFIKDDSLDTLIFKTIKYHNKYQLPKNLTAQEKLFCNIVRDADKIDILYLYTIKDIKIDVENDIFSAEIIDQLKNESVINRVTLKTKADRLAVSLGFLFDIAFKESMAILKEKDYLNKEIDIYMQEDINPKLKEQLEEIRTIIKNYIDRSL